MKGVIERQRGKCFASDHASSTYRVSEAPDILAWERLKTPVPLLRDGDWQPLDRSGLCGNHNSATGLSGLQQNRTKWLPYTALVCVRVNSQ